MNESLSICVVTMNRANQLKDALESCLACKLPEKTEFVIIDNASTDNTEQVVKSVLKNCGYSYYYEKLISNLGVGGGRNYAFERSLGEYIYVLDDDAVIDSANKYFFIKALNIFNEHAKIVTLTTQIYDTMWKKNRVRINGNPLCESLYKCYMFCGGSHFIRKSFFKQSPYLSNKYGFEELPPSLVVADAGMINAFCPELLVEHRPINNRWNYSDEKNHSILIAECAVPHAIKMMMFPIIFRPLLIMGYVKRCQKHLRAIPNGKKRADQVLMETIEHYKIDNNIRIKTVLQMYKEFGISIF